MKTTNIILVLWFFYVTSIAQTPISLSESTLKVPGLGEEIFYFGFAAGDKVTLDFKEINGKELKEVEIIELPSSSKFMDYKAKSVQRSLDIANTGIYAFRFSNSALSGRICRIKIIRVPAEGTANFNSTVYWRELYDTTYTTRTERYLARKEYKTIDVVPVSEFYINSGSNAALKDGRSRIALPVQLPYNTKEWYIKVSASRDKQAIQKTKQTFSFLSELSFLIDQTGALGFGIDMLSKPPGDDICDVYLLDHNNSQLFRAKEAYRYFTEGTRENIKSGIIKINSLIVDGLYIGLRNPDNFQGINVLIEVAAITEEEVWETRTVTVPNVTTRRMAYLKN